MKLALAAAMLAALLTPFTAQAQNTQTSQVTWSATAGGTRLPDAMGTRCGRNGGSSFGFDATGALLVRPWRLLVLQGDTRATHAFRGGCSLIGFAVDTSYPGKPTDGLMMSSSARIGLETPSTLPLIRLTAGRGILWRSFTDGVVTLASFGGAAVSSNRPRYWVFGGAVGTRGRRHVLLEVDRLSTRIGAYEDRKTFGSSGATLEQRGIILSPSWWSVRLGIEWALSQ